MKKIVTSNLERYRRDINKHLILTTDASEHSIGAVLSQTNETGKEQMISTISEGLDNAQLNYPETAKELLGLIKCIEHYRRHSLGKESILRTDHKALAYLWESKNPCSRFLMWTLKSQNYSLKVEYIKGENNLADSVNRLRIISLKEIKHDYEALGHDRNRITEEHHIKLGCGSANTIKHLILKKYHQEGIFEDTEKHVIACRFCAKAGGLRKKST